MPLPECTTPGVHLADSGWVERGLGSYMPLVSMGCGQTVEALSRGLAQVLVERMAGRGLG